jgi:hypothetical protein
MGHRIACAFGATGLGLAALLACAPAGAKLPRLSLPGHHAKPIVPTEGPWFVRAGQTQDIWANTGSKPQAMQTYLCVTARPGGARRVDLVLEGRAPMNVEGCTSVYLELAPGERVAIANPSSGDAVGTYRFDLQGQPK